MTIMQSIELTDGGGVRREYTAVQIGAGSSHRADKQRWFEVTIYRTSTGKYLLHTVGRTSITGESDRFRLIETASAFEIVERCIVAHDNRVYIPSQSLRAITTASQYDDDMLEALREVPNMINARTQRVVHQG
jgi:ATP-dependent DNA ligase